MLVMFDRRVILAIVADELAELTGSVNTTIVLFASTVAEFWMMRDMLNSAFGNRLAFAIVAPVLLERSLVTPSPGELVIVLASAFVVAAVTHVKLESQLARRP